MQINQYYKWCEDQNRARFCPLVSSLYMHFEDIEMVNVTNLIIIDQEYCPWNQCNQKVCIKIEPRWFPPINYLLNRYLLMFILNIEVPSTINISKVN